MMDLSIPPSSPYTYARDHKLCVDHRLFDPSLLPPLPGPLVLERSLQHIEADDLANQLQDSWTVPSDCATYLSFVLGPATGDDYHDAYKLCVGLHRLKLDRPALTQDHEDHMRKLVARTSRVIMVKDMKKFLTSKRYSMALATADLQDDGHGVHPLIDDRFSVSREAAACIEDIIGLSIDQDPSVLSDYKPSRLARADTPMVARHSTPLLPRGTISDMIGDELLPPPQSSEGMWTQELEQEVMSMFDKSFVPAEELLYDQDLDDADCNAPEQSLATAPDCHDQQALRSLRLTSPIFTDESLDFATRPETIAELQTMLSLVSDRQIDNKFQSDEALAEADARLFEQIALPAWANVNQALVSERLVEIDTTLKVLVPALEVYFPTLGAETLSMALSRVRELEGRWKGVIKLERLLCWTPFPAAAAALEWPACLPIEESWRSEETLPSLSTLADELHVELLNSKTAYDFDDQAVLPMMQDGGLFNSTEAQPTDSRAQALDILLDSTVSSQLGDAKISLTTLLQKRKHELAGHSDNSLDAGAHARKKALLQTTRLSRDTDLLRGGLDQFLLAHGALNVSKSLDASMEYQTEPYPAANESLPATAEVLPRLALPHDTAGFQIIISTSIMLRRSMIDDIRDKLRNLTVIEREQVGYGEADLILSAGCGIVLTTMQQVRQKPLPGSTNRSALKPHLEHTSTLYAQLYVLVSEASLASHPSRPIDEHDCDALSELIAFTETLDNSVTVLYIAGNEAELSSWLCGLISLTACSLDRCRLAQDESMWERFLRRCGLNAFAAQSVLAQMRLPDHAPGPPSGATAYALAQLASLARPSRTLLLQKTLSAAAASKLNAVFDNNAWFTESTAYKPAS